MKHRCRVVFLIAPLFFLFMPSILVAQSSCITEGNIVASWNTAVEADKKAITNLQANGHQDSLQLSNLGSKLKTDTQHLQQSQDRLAACLSRTNSNVLSPLDPTSAITFAKPTANEFEIQGVGRLSLGKPEPRAQKIGAKLILATDQFEGIPRGTILEMAGTLAGTSLDIKGSKVTKGDYLHLDHEVPSYEYTLRIIGQLNQQTKTPRLEGNATLVKSIRYRADAGQTIRSFGIVGMPPETTIVGSLCGGGACPACRKCNGGQCIADDSMKFDDGKFCTSCDGVRPGPDCCRGGRGLAKQIEDEEVVTGTVEQWDFAELARLIKKAHEVAKFGPCELPPISVSGAINLTRITQCCEEKKNLENGVKYGGSLSFEGFGVECPVPGLSLKIPHVAELGVVVGATLSAEASGNGINGPCTECGWSVEAKGGIVATGKVVAETTIDPSLLKIEAGVHGEGTLQGACKCDGCSHFTACIGPLTVFGTATMAGFFSKAIEAPIPYSQRCL